ncbi:hypothetical protein VD0004_g8955 [Verticillium dahliae]|nr:hypothetical protein VD0004_g8955 [Verticillium dahliae]PNH64061.1 hypothetical protein VD0001_g8966 [Verticillium dahliae]
MNQLLCLLLAATPAANAMAAYIASLPQEIAALVATDDCQLPDEFSIQNFVADSADGGKTLDSYEFGFFDDSTTVDTSCLFNSTSKAVNNDGRTPRYSCNDARVNFIWQNGSLTLIEGVCAGEDGAADYEASGTAPVAITCTGGNGTTANNATATAASNCKADSADIQAKFFSIQPAPPKFE